MNDRLVFTTDPKAFPKDTFRKLIHDLHDKDQHFSMPTHFSDIFPLTLSSHDG
jgi:hypothetical protein